MSDHKKLPKILEDFVIAQNQHNSYAYVKDFADDAIVHDESKDYNGKSDIKQWNETTNEMYHTNLEPIEFSETKNESVLTVKVSGTFDGSPIILKYHFVIKDNKIISLIVKNN